jgi:hypothetical protein
LHSISGKKPKKLNIQWVKPGIHKTGDTDEIRVPYTIMFCQPIEVAQVEGYGCRGITIELSVSLSTDS